MRIAMKSITSRLMEIEREIGRLNRCVSIDQFQAEWKSMDELSQAVIMTYAECPEMQEGATNEELRIYGYLRSLKYVKCVYDLDDIFQKS